MRKRIAFILALVTLVSCLCACNGPDQAERIDDSVLAAWEGKFSKDARKTAIAEYFEDYVSVYAVNIESSCVSFKLNFEAVEYGPVTLAPVDDSIKDFEVNTVVDFGTDLTVDGDVATVKIDWWYDAPAATKQYVQWSYLFWIKDSEGVQHYFYFRVNYKT